MLAVAWLTVPETSGSRRVKLDLGGALLISAALACVVVPLSEGRDQGWPVWVFVVLALVPLLSAAFLRYEDRLAARGGMPLVDLRLMAIPSFRRGVLVGTLFFFTTSFYLLFSIYQQDGRGDDPLHTGLAILPYGIGLFVGPLASAPFERLRPKLLAIGMAVQVSGYAAIGVAVGLGLDAVAGDAGGADRRLRPGDRLSAAVQHGARATCRRRRRAGQRHRQFGAAGGRGGQRGGDRQPVLLGAGGGRRASGPTRSPSPSRKAR